MTALTDPTTVSSTARTGAPVPGPDPRIAGIPFARLLLVEWRKQLDTRAGRWLLITIGVVVIAVLAIMLATGDGRGSLEGFIMATVTPLSMLLPVVGILAATSEWSQRTALVTFTLEPRRSRVGFAKLLSVLGSGVVFFALAVGVAALVHLGLVVSGGTGDWGLDVAVLGGTLLLVLLSMAQGVAFGALLLNTPAAIVTYFVLPTVFMIVGGLIPAMADVRPWIDLGISAGPLMGGAPTGQEWAQIGTSSLVWVVAPLVGGLVRVARSEVRSS